MSVLQAGECEQIDTELTLAIDSRGGSYTTDSAIVLGAATTTTQAFRVTALATLDHFEGHVPSGKELDLDAGSVLRVQNLAGLIVDDGGAITLASDVSHGGGVLTCNGKINVGGTGSQLNLNADSTTTLKGTSGAHLARLNLADNSLTTIDGSPGHLAALTIGQNTSTDINGTVTLTSTGVVAVASSGYVHWLNGALATMDTGSVFLMGASTTRTGKLIRSGANAHEGMRRFTGPDNDWTVPSEQYDTVKVPSTLTAARTWTLAAPTDTTEAIDITIQASVGSAGFALTLKYLASTLATLTDDADRPPGAVTFEWDPGDLLYRVKCSTSVACDRDLTKVGSNLRIPS